MIDTFHSVAHGAGRLIEKIHAAEQFDAARIARDLGTAGIRLYRYGTDNIAFTFVSDEFNGVTRDNAGNVRPLVQRSFSSLSQAEEENGQSRIYLGIHWAFDKTAAIAQGRRVADYVFTNAFLP